MDSASESNASESESMQGGGNAKYAIGSDSSKLGHCLNIHTQLTCQYVIGIRNLSFENILCIY